MLSNLNTPKTFNSPQNGFQMHKKPTKMHPYSQNLYKTAHRKPEEHNIHHPSQNFDTRTNKMLLYYQNLIFNLLSPQIGNKIL